jgi:hypothetical protein
MAVRPCLPERILWIGLGAVLVYLHYTAAAVLVFETLFVVAAWLIPQRRAWAVAVLGDLVIAGLLCMAALPHALEIEPHRMAWSSLVKKTPWTDMLRVIHGGWYVLPAAALWILGRPFAGSSRRCPGSRPFCRNALVLCWWLVPVVGAWVSTQLDIAPLLLNRYLMASAAAPIILSGLLLSGLPRTIRAFAMILFVAYALFQNGYRELLQGGPPRFGRGENWRALVQQLQKRSAALPRMPILIRTGLIEADRLNPQSSLLFRAYCRLPLLGLYAPQGWPVPVVPLRGMAPYLVDESVVSRLAAAPGVWLVVRAPERRARQVAADIAREVGIPLRVARLQSFGRVHLLELVADR